MRYWIVLLVAVAAHAWSVTAADPAPAAEGAPPATAPPPAPPVVPNALTAWSYTGGKYSEDKWSSMTPDFAACEKGQKQSPIDINKNSVERYVLSATTDSPITVDWQDLSRATVFYNGVTLQVEVSGTDGARNLVRQQNQTFPLAQIFIHTPSEHSVDGKRMAGEIQFLHKQPDDDRTIAVSVLLTEGKSEELGGVLRPITERLILRKNERSHPTMLNLKRLMRLTGGPSSYWSYEGSQTMPPCKEVVNWYILDTPVPVTATQIGRIFNTTQSNVRSIRPRPAAAS